jgi:PhnB protein
MPQHVKPVPAGYHTVTPHLVVKDAAKAIDFYKRAFGAEVLFRMNGPDGKSVMHAELRIGDSPVMIAEEAPQWGALGPQSLGGSPVTISLYVTDADAVYNRAVQAGAEATMPLANQFWGDRYGKLKDPFGHHWAVMTHVEDVSPEECQRRAAGMFAKGGCKPEGKQ